MQRSYSFAERAEQDMLIQNVKTNVIESGAQRREPFSNDNYQIVVDPTKEEMKIAKRGQATINMKVNDLPKHQGVVELLNQNGRRGSIDSDAFEFKDKT